ncbi:hypothetical protein RIF29_34161 [Crotalaria pallida]|uniref:TPX2 central domain-containing protein n=1 Tax=Crotalaria pallida TaxID=3830 RepID=A0AAN9EBE6_CROPI
MTMTMTLMEEGEGEIQHVFVAHEIDLDYEFDAPRFFDFTRPESPSQAHHSQLWFLDAPSYPPSPFVRRLVVREELSLDNVRDSPKSKHLESNVGDYDDEKSSVSSGVKFSDTYLDNNGLTFCSKTIDENLSSKAKSAVLKSSTLLKPTASQLAKQNRPPKNVASRFQKLLGQNERNLSTSSGIETQAAKRQKLEGGHLCKANDVKQQANFVHKAPKRVVAAQENSACSKLRITIPREPDLKTAHRAQRIRPKDVAEAEHVTIAAPRFKARPLNRKVGTCYILDAPSMPIPKRSTPQLPKFQEFHLKTGERAMQHIFATSSSSLLCNDSEKGLDKHTAVSALKNRTMDLRRPSAMSALKFDRLGYTRNFQDRHLNKKILPSKEDFVFHNCKQETTEPMVRHKEFNFYTEKGVQHNPPIELFSKLSLTSEVQPNNGSHMKLQHSGTCRKGLGDSVTINEEAMCNQLLLLT